MEVYAIQIVTLVEGKFKAKPCDIMQEKLRETDQNNQQAEFKKFNRIKKHNHRIKTEGAHEESKTY